MKPSPLALALTLVLAASRPARADTELGPEETTPSSVDQDRHYVSVGGSASGDTWIYALLFAEAGIRFDDHDLWGYARVAGGQAGDVEVFGGVFAPAIGIEGRRCIGRLCGSLGGELGGTFGTIENYQAERTYRLSSISLGLRAAAEVRVAGPVGLRLALEAHRVLGGSGEMDDTPVGAGASLGLVYRF